MTHRQQTGRNLSSHTCGTSYLQAVYLILAAGLLLPQRLAAAGGTYRNPIARNVADPFVLKHRGEYYLYRTEINGALDVQTSRDLVHWQVGPVVWRPEQPGGPNSRLRWAPEVYTEN